MDIFIAVMVGIVGLSMGSFAGATVWRLRADELQAEKSDGAEYDKKEYKKLQALMRRKSSTDRSRCLECGHQLAWFDLIPLASWLSTRGKCRYCKHAIGRYEPLMELGVMAAFLLSYLYWPYQLLSPYTLAMFVIWLAAVVLMAMLFAYDTKWMLLPVFLMIILAVLGTVFAVLRFMEIGYTSEGLVNLIGGMAILSGLYFLLYMFSKGAWVGNGDYKLGFGLALFLGSFPASFIALFLANVIGLLVILPGTITGKLSRTAHVPLGPLLILGSFITFLFANSWPLLIGL